MNESKVQLPFSTITICLATATIILISIYSSIHGGVQSTANRIKLIIENQLKETNDMLMPVPGVPQSQLSDVLKAALHGNR